MSSLELNKKKSSNEMTVFQNNMSLTDFAPRTESYLSIENTIFDSSIKEKKYDSLLDVNTWKVVEIPAPSISSSVRDPIDLELQSLSQKVMKRIWDNKEDEFWSTY